MRFAETGGRSRSSCDNSTARAQLLAEDAGSIDGGTLALTAVNDALNGC